MKTRSLLALSLSLAFALSAVPAVAAVPIADEAPTVDAVAVLEADTSATYVLTVHDPAPAIVLEADASGPLLAVESKRWTPANARAARSVPAGSPGEPLGRRERWRT